MTTASRTYIRTAGAHSPEWLAEQDRKATERREALESRIAERRENANPELLAALNRMSKRRGR